MTDGARVSVVIPSADRPELVVRAARSALGQTLRPIEVVVVLDGYQPDSERSLAAIDDRRLVVVRLPDRAGAAAARNAGVRASRSARVAFLDDDDEWLEDKLESQLERVEAGAARFHSTPIIARDDRGDRRWPGRARDRNEPLSEYLFVRRSARWTDGLVHTSTWLVDRGLLLDLPFREQTLHEDLVWLLDAEADLGVRIDVDMDLEPSTVWHVETDRQRLSSGNRWPELREWSRLHSSRMTARARSAYLLTWVTAQARRERAWGAAPGLLWEAVRMGRPRWVDLALFAALWVAGPRSR